MESRFTSEFFAGNRKRLRELFTGKAPIVITANGLVQRGGDSTFPFAQDANFWYLTGIDEPDVVLVMDKDAEYLILPQRASHLETFNGTLTPEAAAARSGVAEVLKEVDGWKRLGARVKRVKHLATIAAPPAYIDFYGMYTNPARRSLIRKLRAYKPDIDMLDISEHLARMRVVKQPLEVQAIQAAIDITNETIKAIMKPPKRQKYIYEYEIEAELTRGFRVRGAKGHGFDPIVASGVRACTIHHMSNNAPLVADELVLLDVGAEVEHYSADISRTFSLGTPTKRQIAVHEAVLDVQAYAMSLLKPGVNFRNYEVDVEHYMGEKLRELGLIKTVGHDEVRRYYPHATSHYLGLNVHDIGDRHEGIIPEGAVITVEPGIYIPEEGLGIRIEDDVLITKDGLQILSNALPRILL